jgi:hypothetical protein
MYKHSLKPKSTLLLVTPARAGQTGMNVRTHLQVGMLANKKPSGKCSPFLRLRANDACLKNDLITEYMEVFTAFMDPLYHMVKSYHL